MRELLAALAPVEYGAAVDRYLEQATLGPASRRVYRVSLAGWAWPLTGRPAPRGRSRRGAPPPMVPLAVLDDPGTAALLASAVAKRAGCADARTVNREISALRSAVGWWQEQAWIAADPTAGLRHLSGLAPHGAALSAAEMARLLRHAGTLREHAFWRVLHDSGAPAADVLALDIGSLDLARHRGRVTTLPGQAGWITWTSGTTQLLRWLIAGRTDGPVFLTDRRAPRRSRAADVCPLTGRGRMSYRRAAEILAAVSRRLQPQATPWTLHRLRGQAGEPGQQDQPKKTSASA
ncbi:MAG TPA: site-specific recombinase [Streptosporangiaceae bacterium]|nr:site-specific recombinase [Streptosporangiaceae bacterium]